MRQTADIPRRTQTFFIHRLVQVFFNFCRRQTFSNIYTSKIHCKLSTVNIQSSNRGIITCAYILLKCISLFKCLKFNFLSLNNESAIFRFFPINIHTLCLKNIQLYRARCSC